jgi:hypothetical protein
VLWIATRRWRPPLALAAPVSTTARCITVLSSWSSIGAFIPVFWTGRSSSSSSTISTTRGLTRWFLPDVRGWPSVNRESAHALVACWRIRSKRDGRVGGSGSKEQVAIFYTFRFVSS